MSGFEVGKLVDTITEDGPMLAVIGIALYIGYKVITSKGKVGK